MDGLTYDHFEDESEARKIARLIEEVREQAQDIISKLAYEEWKFLYEYINGSIEIEPSPECILIHPKDTLRNMSVEHVRDAIGRLNRIETGKHLNMHIKHKY